MADESPDDGPRSFAARLDLLFKSAHAAGTPEVGYQEVVDAIAESGGPSITPTYLYMLRTGRRENPSVQLIQALGRYFNVPTAFFLDDTVAADLASQLELLAALRDSDVQRLALRSHGLSPESRAALATMIDRLRQVEGLVDDPKPPEP